MAVGLKDWRFDPAKPDVTGAFRSLVGHLMWVANQTRPGIVNAVRAIARKTHAPTSVHWNAQVLTYIIRLTRGYTNTFQRGKTGGIGVEVLCTLIPRAGLPTRGLSPSVF